MREFGFELALCVHLEAATDWVLARQLGGAVADPGGRVVDVVGVVPGPEFDARTRITPETAPPLAVESDVGVGTAVDPREGFARFDVHPDHVREVVDRAVEVGFFEATYRGGRRLVRRATRYPEEWFTRLVAVENKPDLGTPGDLEAQLRTDVSLALFDRAYLATESYVTRAHLNRIPEAVGVWRFEPETGEREVVREAAPLPVDEPGVEPLASHPLRTDVALVPPEAKARKRRRVVERAYGKGWRTYAMPGCAAMDPTDDGRPHCAHHGRTVDPAVACGHDCPGFAESDPPAVDRGALRDARTPWVADPAGVVRRQSGLDRFE